ncbi:MAG: SCO family protein [Burkholderiales bacterium]|nr:SCO family protein [Burkholderiales bacterium]
MDRSRRTILARVAALAAAIALAGCGPDKAKFKGSDVTGSPFGRDFALTDHDGRARTLADWKGRVVVLFFGYTQCPDVCPTTLSTLAEAMKALGPDADRVQVLFASVDPDRDTAELLRQYVPAFDPRFVGLRGEGPALEAVTREFKVIYQKVPGTTPTTYTVDHSAGTFLFDPKGRLRVYEGHGQTAEGFAQDIRALLKEG